MCIYMYNICMCVCVFNARWGATVDHYVIKKTVANKMYSVLYCTVYNNEKMIKLFT